jgi:hypothetical protein
MTGTRIGRVLALAAGLAMCAASNAKAVCVITAASASPLAASTGTYTPPALPNAQAVSIQVNITYLALVAGTCTLAMSFHRSTLPASMVLVGGGTATMPYSLQTSSSGGNSLFYTGGLPDASNALIYAFAAPILGVPGTTTKTFTVYALASPAALQQAGGYQDSITLDLSNVTLDLVVTKVSSQAFLVTGQVAKSCTIGGQAHPAADTVTIPLTASGDVNTSPINRSYPNAICNAPTNVQLTSQNGAVVTGGAGGGLQNRIDYAATALFSGATASLDTASIPTANGSESGIAAPTMGVTPTGNLGVTITPEANGQPLVAGSYADTLMVTLTPQ